MAFPLFSQLASPSELPQPQIFPAIHNTALMQESTPPDRIPRDGQLCHPETRKKCSAAKKQARPPSSSHTKEDQSPRPPQSNLRPNLPTFVSRLFPRQSVMASTIPHVQ
ncbi:uncharacterized protein K444DRAFT_606428, partial [Hyaloscypha bicolor E]